MSWLHRYRFRFFLHSSFWVFPALSMLAAMGIAPVVRWLDGQIQWSWFNFSPDGARAVLGAFTSSMLTFMVFVLSSILIVVQLASAQLTPRIIAQVFSRRLIKVALAVFTFSYVYTLAALSRVEATVPQLPVALSVASNLVCIVIFFAFVKELGLALRPIAAVQYVAKEGHRVVQSVYPHGFDPAREASEHTTDRLPQPSRVIEHTGASGVVMAFSPADIVAIAKYADAVVELVPQVGDFIAQGEPLFRVAAEKRPADERALRHLVAIGPERTIEQDPRFAFRILVDIANKALSPAINDPTTAVLAVDQIQDLLRHVGMRQLGSGEMRDADSCLRLLYPAPKWEDFVCLGASEIRQYGAGSLQVVRRLRAMLLHLMQVLPESRLAPLREELDLLHRAVERQFPDLDDRERAEISDYQGVGGAAREEP